MKQRQLPHSHESEVALLGSILVYPKALPLFRDSGLTEKDFYSLSHQTLVKHIMILIESEGSLEVGTLVDRLTDHNDLIHAGGMDYLINLTMNATSISSFEHYVNNVKEKSQARELIEVSEQIKEQGFNTSLPVNELLDQAEESVLNITRSRQVTAIRDSVSVVNDMMLGIEKAMQSDGGLTGLATGFSHLNNITHGFQNGDLIILGARPSMGKTALALNFATNVARLNDANVAIFSLEMPDTHLMQRVTSSVSLIEGGKLKSGRLNDREYQELNKASHIIKQIGFHIDDSSSITVPEIFTQCRRLKNDDKLDFVVIDYMQLITGDANQQGNRQQEISKISRQMKQLAREMEVPVLALSQLSRSLESREDKRPILSDLRESGSIEQDADIVMFLHRDDYFDRDNNEDKAVDANGMDISPTLLRISKHRNGALADIDLAFVPAISKFYDVEN